jgi:hypothetical protein
MGLGIRIDHSAYLGHPQLHLVVDEDRERESVLVAVEGPLRFPDHHRLEPALWVLQGIKQQGCLRPAFPRDRARLPDVEELGHDLTVALTQGAGPSDLPAAGCLRVLLILRGYPPIEREPRHYAASLPCPDRPHILMSSCLPVESRAHGCGVRCAAAVAALRQLAG